MSSDAVARAPCCTVRRVRAWLGLPPRAACAPVLAPGHRRDRSHGKEQWALAAAREILGGTPPPSQQWGGKKGKVGEGAGLRASILGRGGA